MPKVATSSSDGLSIKERTMLKHYTDPSSSTYLNAGKSAELAYDTSSNASARVIGCRVSKKLAKINNGDISSELASKLNAEWVLDKLTQEVENKAKRSSDRIKALELIGRFKELNLWRDQSVVENISPVTENEQTLDIAFKELVASRSSN